MPADIQPTRSDVRHAFAVCPCWGDPATGPVKCDLDDNLPDEVCELHHNIARALAAEREACALDIEALAYIGQPRQITVRECAAAIRERGKEKDNG